MHARKFLWTNDFPNLNLWAKWQGESLSQALFELYDDDSEQLMLHKKQSNRQVSPLQSVCAGLYDIQIQANQELLRSLVYKWQASSSSRILAIVLVMRTSLFMATESLGENLIFSAIYPEQVELQTADL